MDLIAQIEHALSLTRDVEELYETWWASAPGALADSAPTHRADNGVVRHPRETWDVVHRHNDGGLTVHRDGDSAYLPLGSWLSLAGDAVQAHRRATWSHGSWAWFATRRPQPLSSTLWRLRIYVPGPAEHSAVQSLVEELDRTGIWCQAKAWRGESSRSDQVLLWVGVSQGSDAISVVRDWTTGQPSREQRPPPLTLRAPDNRLGIAHDPPDGDSYGQRICAAIVAAGDVDHAAEPHDRWKRAAELHHLHGEAPWRHPEPHDPFGFWSRIERDYS